MNKFISNFFAVLSILLLILATGAIEADNFMIGFAIFITALATMFITMSTQGDSYDES
tara:strand:+ start:427 stop:600 length:174 start_codon:yes stop_codon:yes gene_type:complete